jgi:hypothetical protein
MRVYLYIYVYMYIHIYIYIGFNRESAIMEQKEKRRGEEVKHQIIAELIHIEDQITSSYHLLVCHHLSRIHSIYTYIYINKYGDSQDKLIVTFSEFYINN